MQAKFNIQKLRALQRARDMAQADLTEQSSSTGRYIRDLESGSSGRERSFAIDFSSSSTVMTCPSIMYWSTQ